MIEGIEILNVVDITEAPDIMVVFLIGLALSIIILFISALADWGCIQLLACFLSIICWFGFIITNNMKVSTGEYEYNVTIDDTVSATTLYENYEVIDQQGKIWTIRPKEKDNE